MVISNCEITKQDSKVLKDCVLDKSSELYRVYKEFHTGVDIEGSDIYSAYDGTVVLIGEDNVGQSVIIQTGSSFCICYKELDAVFVRAGDQLSQGTRIGHVKKYVHIELLQHKTNNWPVRIGSATWYKVDPQPIFDRTLNYANDTSFWRLGIKEIPYYDTIPQNKLTDGEILYILTDNKGD